MPKNLRFRPGKAGPSDNRFRPGTIKRLFHYMAAYRTRMALVIICIILSAAASAASALFLQVLVDRYILPLVGQAHPVMAKLFRALLFMGAVYLTGVLTTLAYNRMVVTIEQGTLKKIRADMFAHMQTLPIRYFDTNTHGEIMSRYTNDTDTLRQAIS